MEGGGSAPTNFAEWAEAIARPGRWLDSLAVLAAARRVMRRVAIVQHPFSKKEVVATLGPGPARADI
eukprot:8605089-Alexandrium_andersonii.AAC.1